MVILKQKLDAELMSFRNVEPAFCVHKKDRIHQGDILRDVFFKKFVGIKQTEGDSESILEDAKFSYVVILSQECDLKWDSENRIELNVLGEITDIQNEYQSMNTKDDPSKLRDILSKINTARKKLTKDIETYGGLIDTDFVIRETSNDDIKKLINKIEGALSRLIESINNDKCIPNVLVCPAYLETDFINGKHIENAKMNNMVSQLKEIQDNNKFKRYHFIKGAQSDNINMPNLVVDFKHFYTLPVEYLYTLYTNSYVCSLNVLFNESIAQRFTFFLSRIGLPESHDTEE